ncbi:phosphoethanolamine transferase [Comamonas testosteroni]|uniref:phosphoethanolamine transferase n=1 Tax=Comamonas testosteroni TaxID=285 RepID=UPI00209F9EC4|nr:phosphoethanolamine transferase [Comamonas testosteroni]
MSQTSIPSDSPASHGMRVSWSALSGLAAIVLFFIVLGHDGRRVAQLLVLMVPVLVSLAWPIRSHAWLKARHWLSFVWVMLFALDGTMRAYLMELYQSSPEGAMVIGAMANTNWRESSEYLSMHWRSVVLIFCGLALLALLVWHLTGRTILAALRRDRRLAVLSLIVALVCALAYSSKPWRRLHPAIFWTQWVHSAQKLKASLADQHEERARLLDLAIQARPTLADAGPSTVVLVLSESINRDNLSLYGYDRQTTPQLQEHQRTSGPQMTVLRNAWSVDASTLPAVRNLFGFGAPGSTDSHHLVALARASGYKVWWISNHDDVGIEQQHARLADIVQMVNRTPGRSSVSLDGEMVDELKTALDAPSERKFIVVHMLGAHPHYSLRYPKGQNPFDDEADAIDASLKNKGTSLWVRRQRQEYDAALLYHDYVVAETLRLTQSAALAKGKVAWMYLSDHGQEVGHVRNHAGHSKSTEAGYRIPAIIWRTPSSPSLPEDVAQRPFRSDWAAWTIADLLDLRWSSQSLERNVLSKTYRWEEPRLPMPVSSFTR